MDAPTCPIAARLVVPAGACAEIVVDTDTAPSLACGDELGSAASYVAISNESARFTRLEVYSVSTRATDRLCIAEATAPCGVCATTACAEGPVDPGAGGVGFTVEERASFVIAVTNDGEPVRIVACDLFP